MVSKDWCLKTMVSIDNLAEDKGVCRQCNGVRRQWCRKTKVSEDMSVRRQGCHCPKTMVSEDNLAQDKGVKGDKSRISILGHDTRLSTYTTAMKTYNQLCLFLQR